MAPTTRRVHRPTVTAALLLALLGGAGSAAEAQALRGRLLDADSRQPISGATVTLFSVVLHDEGRAVRAVITDEQGLFRISGVTTGRYRLGAERIGYQEVRSPPFDMIEGEVLEVELVAAVNAVPLAPLTVTAGREALVLSPRLAMSGFYERQETYGRKGMGFGHFLTRDNPELRTAFYATDIFRHVAGTRVVSSGRGYDATVLLRTGCIPTIYLNGAPIRTASGISINELVSASDLSGVEIYVGLTAPVEFMDMTAGNRPCGSIVLWTGR